MDACKKLYLNPLPNGEESHVKAKLREGIHSSPYFPRHPVPTALLSPQGSSLFTPEPALLWVGLRPLRRQLLLVMLQGGQAGTLCLSLLWKEAVALKACPGSQSPEAWSWAPTHGPC